MAPRATASAEAVAQRQASYREHLDLGLHACGHTYRQSVDDPQFELDDFQFDEHGIPIPEVRILRQHLPACAQRCRVSGRCIIALVGDTHSILRRDITPNLSLAAVQSEQELPWFAAAGDAAAGTGSASASAGPDSGPGLPLVRFRKAPRAELNAVQRSMVPL